MTESSHAAPAKAQPVFTKKAITWLVGVGGASLILGIVVAVFSDSFVQPSAGTHSYSPSAIGHQAFYELLHELDIPVVRARSAQAISGYATVIVAEPGEGSREQPWRDRDLAARVERAYSVLLVLPKRKSDLDWAMLAGRSDGDRPAGWAVDTRLRSVDDVERTLRRFSLPGEVVRLTGHSAAASSGSSAGPDRSIASKSSNQWSGISGDAAPSLSPLQLLRAEPDQLHPIIWTDDGVLFGWVALDEGTLFVLSDPDLIATHGLANPDNAVVAIEVIEELRDGDGPVIIDEVSHGFLRRDSIWRELLSFPLLPGTLHVLLAALLCVLAGARRFGRAIPAPPAIEPGKAYLIQNSAALLGEGRHTGHALIAYRRSIVREVRARLHVPADLRGDDLRAHLTHLASARRVSEDLATIDLRAKALSGQRGRSRAALGLARSFHRWRQEMLRGVSHDS